MDTDLVGFTTMSTAPQLSDSEFILDSPNGPLIHLLPDAMLLEIFRLAVIWPWEVNAMEEEFRMLVPLLLVCRRWHDLALHTHRYGHAFGLIYTISNSTLGGGWNAPRQRKKKEKNPVHFYLGSPPIVGSR
ncbi:hypothetical protein BDV98DRAFT_571813 [Pterulicium gracile]|uniref:Uncharacterized protein n=1 Tax=Pterulicium gracile TaxID=1884261 RepID=A0A5C3QG94_9AGAR|nr:hypothetical protein BDV98DRAFT_571813 [Pterula gracilis]